MFPVTFNNDELDSRGLFPCQAPYLRDRVLPLFSFDPQHPETRPRGHGTTFRIDAWSRCATAFHVVEDIFEPVAGQDGSLKLRPDIRLAALQLDGLIFGTCALPKESWRPISEAFSVSGIDNHPLMPSRFRNFCELMVLRILPNVQKPSVTPYLPLDLKRWRPQMGETVLALGYADLDIDEDGHGDQRPIDQCMYGSFGKIIDVEPADPNRMRPWPQIRIEKEWPPGMSGGPVFNEAGHVVGIVSAGISALNLSSATYFSGWNLPSKIFGSLDETNPGWFKCHAVFGRGIVIYCSQSKQEAEAFAASKSLSDIGIASVNIETRDFIRLS